MISRGDLSITERFSATKEHPEDAFDLAVVVASWDSRCLEVTKLPITAKRVLLVDFKNKGETGRSNKHKNHLSSWAESIAEYVSECEIDSLAVADSVRVWKNTLSKETRPGDRIFVDVSSFPKSHMLTLFGILLRATIIKDISLFYAEADYVLEPVSSPVVTVSDDGTLTLASRTASGFSLTSGAWSTMTIPYLDGLSSPERPRHMLVSLGGEGVKTQALLEQYEPEVVSLIYPVPGISERYDQIARYENSVVGARFKERIASSVDCPYGSAGEVFRYCCDSYINNDSEDVYFLCCGSKPHAIGLALAVRVLNGPTLVVRVPTSYMERNNPPTGASYLYSIRKIP